MLKPQTLVYRDVEKCDMITTSGSACAAYTMRTVQARMLEPYSELCYAVKDITWAHFFP